jgi:KaiC/GvpD/RAD55 family RecA-like ATPase
VSKSNATNAHTGISEIDYLCGGDISRSVIVLVEETGTEKSNFPSFFLSMKFLNDGFLKGERGVLVLTEHAASEYLKITPVIGVDLLSHKNSGLLTIIDAFSGYAGATAELIDNKADITIDNPNNTVKLLDEIRNLLLTSRKDGYEGKVRMVIDSFSTLMIIAGFQKSWNLLIGLLPIHKLTGCTTMAILFPGMHATNEVESFERLLDGVIEFSGSDIEVGATTFVQIKKMRRNPFREERTPYTREAWNIKVHLNK